MNSIFKCYFSEELIGLTMPAGFDPATCQSQNQSADQCTNNFNHSFYLYSTVVLIGSKLPSEIVSSNRLFSWPHCINLHFPDTSGVHKCCVAIISSVFCKTGFLSTYCTVMSFHYHVLLFRLHRLLV